MYGANDLQEKVDFFRGGLGTSWISGDWPYHLSPQEQKKYLDLKIRKTSNQTLSAEVVVGKTGLLEFLPLGYFIVKLSKF